MSTEACSPVRLDLAADGAIGVVLAVDDQAAALAGDTQSVAPRPAVQQRSAGGWVASGEQAEQQQLGQREASASAARMLQLWRRAKGDKCAVRHLYGAKARGFAGNMLTTNPFDDDKLHEECGIFGIWGADDAASFVALGLHALQHRGQEAAGITSFDGRTSIRTARTGPCRRQFRQR